MKIFLRLTAVCLTFALVLVLSGFTSDDNNAADVIKDFGCNISGPDGAPLSPVEGKVQVITSSGNLTLICKAKGVEVDLDKAWHDSGFPCGTFLGLTFDSHKTVTPSGNATLVCMVKHE